MKTELSPEMYKGISIKVVKNILPSKTFVEAIVKVKGKLKVAKATTKQLAVLKAKKFIDGVLK